MIVILSEVNDRTISMKAFDVFMMTDQSPVVLCTRITNSLMRRAWQHQSGKIGGFTKAYKVGMTSPTT
jgi:predicted GIY-YIG superfamily endonuclease